MPKNRKRSNDPRQEQLRALKDSWNAATSAFISNMIALKRGLNGRGDAKKGIAPSKIQDPLPAEIGSALSSISSDFQALMNEAESIISAQANYSQVRRKKQPKRPKQPGAPQNPAPAPQEAASGPDRVVETLSTLGSSKARLIEKYGSSRLTRGLEYVKSLNPFSRKQFNRERIGLLRATSDLWFNVLDLENNLLSLSLDTIPSAIEKFVELKYNLEAFTYSLNDLNASTQGQKKDQAPKATETDPNQAFPNPPAPIQTPSQASPDDEDDMIGRNPKLDAEILTVQLRLPILQQQGSQYNGQVQEIQTNINRFLAMDDMMYQGMIAKGIKKLYEELMRSLRANLPDEDFRALWKQVSTIRSQANLTTQGLVKESHNIVSRYLKRKLVQAIKFNKTAVPRLKAIEQIDQIKATLQKMMNSLEKDIDTKLLNEGLQDLFKKTELVHRQLSALKVLNRKNYYARERKKLQKKRPRGEHDDLFMDRVLRRKLWKDLGTEL